MCLLPLSKVYLLHNCNTKVRVSESLKLFQSSKTDHLRTQISIHAIKWACFLSASATILPWCNSESYVSESFQNLQFCLHSYLQPRANGYLCGSEMICLKLPLFFSLKLNFFSRESHTTLFMQINHCTTVSESTSAPQMY